MVFFIVHDGGVVTRPLVASDLAAAGEIVRQQLGRGIAIGDQVGAIQVAILVPDAIATVTPNEDPTLATIDAVFSSSVANRAALIAKAQTALTANATFLALASPTNAQVLAQVQMMTRECNALIRLAIGALDTTTGT